MQRRLREEFETTAMPFLPELLRVATRMCGGRDRAEDLVQETFLQAWRSFARFQTGTNCRAWLYKILMFSHSKQRRSLARQPSLTELDQAGEKALLFDPPTPDVLTAEMVNAAFGRVPEPFRTTMVIVDVEEFTYREAADILDVPIGTVMSRLSRGRKLLRHELAGCAAALNLDTRTRERQGSS
jgi:RNA polymerase sigma-70 factor, ECF subfamily